MKTTSNDQLPLTNLADTETRGCHPPHAPSPEISLLVRSFASVLIAGAVADGNVLEVEMRRIERVLRKTFYLGEADTTRLVREALSDSVEIGSLAFENALEILRERFLPHQRKRFLDALLEVAESDGRVDERELNISAYVCKRLGLMAS